MSCFSNILSDNPEYRAVAAGIARRRLPMSVTGLSHVHKANFAAALIEEFSKKALILTPDEAHAARLVSDLNAFGAKALLFPARDFSFRAAEGQSHEYEHRRIAALYALMNGKCDCVVCPIEAALELTIPLDEFSARIRTLKTGDTYSLDGLCALLLKAGYIRSQQVDGRGQFARRGGILDFFSPCFSLPFRIEMWGDTIDSVSVFDPQTQRSLEKPGEAVITPAREVLCEDCGKLRELIEKLARSVKGKYAQKARDRLHEDLGRLAAGTPLASLDRYMPLLYPQSASVFDYAPDALLFVSESFSVKQTAHACETLMREDINLYLEEGLLCKGLDTFELGWHDVTGLYYRFGAVYLDNLPRGSADTPLKELVTVNARHLSAWNGSLSVLLSDLKPFAEKRDNTCIIMAGTGKAAQNLCSDLLKESISAHYYSELPATFPQGTVSVLAGGLSAGFEYPASKTVLITYGSRQSAVQIAPGSRKKNAYNSLEELKKDDYIVHAVHGIGLYEGIAQLSAAGTVKDYIKIRYDKGDVLYVPVTQLDQVSKYIGPGGEKNVKLNRLGGKEWQKTRSRVSAAVKDMAKQLTALYAKRIQVKGYAFSPDIDMQNDFEGRFEFEETADQLRCIDEVKRDMEKPYPMDRLLCGDVGFGKTEVALRAAFKCVADGKQCALLVPTTILALQHFQTIKKRFEGFPVESAMFSRFCTPGQIKKSLDGLRRGSVDIAVGTHRLISKDVVFKDLGLIIVDEEQRFGVAQKERLKEMYPAVDVLTLTATPIPRTLNMAMTGIRDMSALEEAPQDRVPVQTYVIEHDMDVLALAMSAELRRAGQVYYLHNRVETIDKTAAKIREMLPQARIGVAHGQMDEDELSDIWRRLLEGEIDILVCTTIIETGVDVPNVNTLIIEDADRMGLSQLHQIRGRVGRSPRRASAYFTFTRGKEITDIAQQRLSAIREFTEFGSGFKIAMRDLELRGAGNILGAQQHGHMEAVGYEMYLRLLSEAISEEKGKKPEVPEKECLIDLPINAYIPEEYIPFVPQRLYMYRRIADIRTREDYLDVFDELADRFGDPPDCVTGLLKVALLRSCATRCGIYEIGKRSSSLLLYIDRIDMERAMSLARSMRGRVTISSKGKPHLSVAVKDGEKQLDVLEKIFDYLCGEAPPPS
ncbi:MAG TPA: transcription-repair coupling factor [Clostridiales bacterium]|nr:MAG: Transcription-repair-coupling factor [Firmicutes bacterium ADurb.Bin262]HOU09511.1 transcription-repair coupling factor [Clostridiales bacterium]